MAEKSYEVVVIGGGPAGYAAAIRSAQLGLKTACIDKTLGKSGKPSLGGTCLNWGCIPSKALLDASHKFEEVNQLVDFGISVENASIDIEAMISRKDEVVQQLTSGIGSLFKANGVDSFEGIGRLLANGNVEFTTHDEQVSHIETNNVILAPGSVPSSIDIAPLSSPQVVDSTEALNFGDVPNRLGILGAGVIGLELGSVWNRLGSETILFEALEQFLPSVDHRISRDAKRILSKQGLDIRLGTTVVSVTASDNGVEVVYEAKGEKNTVIVDRMIVAVGRKPNTYDLIATDCGIETDERGFITVNEFCQTSLENVYAVGDAVRGPMLAHKAAEEGIMAAERIFGKKSLVNYSNVPAVIYTHPEIAWVGLSEEQAKGEGFEAEVGTFSFGASGRALAANDREGLVKIISDSSSDRVLGVHILGPQASELIGQAVMAMEFGATSEDIGLTMFAHPSLSEALHEAALGVGGHAIHMANRKKKK